VALADFTGSTSGINRYVSDKQPASVMLITECSMADNIIVANPQVNFVKPCKFCPHMKQITLPKILACLQSESPEITLSADIIERAKGAVQRMIDFKK
jgi:quinolinate synthase